MEDARQRAHKWVERGERALTGLTRDDERLYLKERAHMKAG